MWKLKNTESCSVKAIELLVRPNRDESVGWCLIDVTGPRQEPSLANTRKMKPLVVVPSYAGVTLTNILARASLTARPLTCVSEFEPNTG